MTGANSGAEHSYLARTVEYTTVISGIRLVGSSVLCVLFCGSLLFLFFSAIVIFVFQFTASDYRFWYHQTFVWHFKRIILIFQSLVIKVKLKYKCNDD